MAKLIIKYNDNIIKELKMTHDTVKIGRQADNDILIENIAVSKHHAVIERNEDGYVLTDLESTNGTFVNEKEVKKIRLKNNDKIIIGKHSLQFLTQEPSLQKKITPDFSLDTMMLDTKQQKELLEKQKKIHQEKTKKSYAKILVTQNEIQKEYKLLSPITLIGKSDSAHIKIKGFWLPKTVASIRKEGSNYYLNTVSGWVSVKINGKLASKNWKLFKNDIIEVGKVKMTFNP